HSPPLALSWIPWEDGDGGSGLLWCPTPTPGILVTDTSVLNSSVFRR
ncbi:mCG140131, partial [Mus musculus]